MRWVGSIGGICRSTEISCSHPRRIAADKWARVSNPWRQCHCREPRCPLHQRFSLRPPIAATSRNRRHSMPSLPNITPASCGKSNGQAVTCRSSFARNSRTTRSADCSSTAFCASSATVTGAVALGNRFKKSVSARKLSPEWDCLGIIRRGEHGTVLCRLGCTEKEGEWLGRPVLGYEEGEIRIFSASIF
jgi:hypothetical protein